MKTNIKKHPNGYDLCHRCYLQLSSHNKAIQLQSTLKPLIQMGFDQHVAAIAMKLSDGNINIAIQYLLNKSLNLHQIAKQQKFVRKKFNRDQNLQKIFKLHGCRDKVQNKMHSEYLLQPQTKQNASCDLLQCLSVKRLEKELRSYHAFIAKNENMNDDVASNIAYYCNITLILEDFHHLSQVHEFEEIYNRLMTHCNNGKICALSSCYMLRRNYRDRSSLGGNNQG